MKVDPTCVDIAKARYGIMRSGHSYATLAFASYRQLGAARTRSLFLARQTFATMIGMSARGIVVARS